MRYARAKRALLLLTALAACGGASDTPSVTVKSATPEELVTSDDALDDVTITVDYDDGDGDLGEGIAEVHDCRADGIVTELLLPAIASDKREGSHISGTLELHVNDVGLATLGTQPALCAELGVPSLDASQTVFCVVLVDKAGHEADGDCTAPITLYE
jgi:hypothetical protein